MIHFKVLPKVQQKVLLKIADLVFDLDFYLGGGTAVALHLGHRLSVDFDWFLHEDMRDAFLLSKKLTSAFDSFSVSSVDRGTVHGILDGVKLSFLEYRYSFLKKCLHDEKLNLRLASLEDLLCMKLSAVAQRGTKKDFVDLFFLIKKMQITRVQALNLFCKKYELKDASPVIYGLSWFDDAEKDLMPKMLKKVTWLQIKKFILAW